MLYKNQQEITGVYKGSRVITAIYKGARLVWKAVRSCFGAGYWIDNLPWNNETPWRN